MCLNATRGTTALQASSGGEGSAEGLQGDTSDTQDQPQSDDPNSQASVGPNEYKNNPKVTTVSQAVEPSNLGRSDTQNDSSVATPVEQTSKFDNFWEKLKRNFNTAQSWGPDRKLEWEKQVRGFLLQHGNKEDDWKVTRGNWRSCQAIPKQKNTKHTQGCGNIEFTNGTKTGKMKVEYTWTNGGKNYEWEVTISGTLAGNQVREFKGNGQLQNS